MQFLGFFFFLSFFLVFLLLLDKQTNVNWRGSYVLVQLIFSIKIGVLTLPL